jgi:hypothetical protein
MIKNYGLHESNTAQNFGQKNVTEDVAATVFWLRDRNRNFTVPFVIRFVIQTTACGRFQAATKIEASQGPYVSWARKRVRARTCPRRASESGPVRGLVNHRVSTGMEPNITRKYLSVLELPSECFFGDFVGFSILFADCVFPSLCYRLYQHLLLLRLLNC